MNFLYTSQIRAHNENGLSSKNIIMWEKRATRSFKIVWVGSIHPGFFNRNLKIQGGDKVEAEEKAESKDMYLKKKEEIKESSIKFHCSSNFLLPMCIVPSSIIQSLGSLQYFRPFFLTLSLSMIHYLFFLTLPLAFSILSYSLCL